MKKPTTNGNDLYQIGNDYPQAPISSYFVESSYHDGIYTEIVQSAFEVSGVDGFDNSFFLGKTPVGLNKRVLNVLPQSGWFTDKLTSGVSGDVYGEVSAVSGEAYFYQDYATAEFSGFTKEETTDTNPEG